MFGKTIPIKPDRGTGETLRVHSIFPTIQGEGPLAGTPAVFIRLTGCNLQCFYCDTDFEKGEVLSVAEITQRVAALAKDVIGDAVITGGEPLAQNIVPLIRALDHAGLYSQIETAGTLWQEGMEDACRQNGAMIVCSPKTEVVHRKVASYCRHWKYILRHGELDAQDGLPVFSTQTPGKAARIWRPDFDSDYGTVWVQPCDEYQEGGLARDYVQTHKNMAACINSAMQHGYRISLQLHKILGIE